MLSTIVLALDWIILKLHGIYSIPSRMCRCKNYFSAERPRSLAPTCFWRQSLLRRRRAKSAEGMGVKCIGLFGLLLFSRTPHLMRLFSLRNSTSPWMKSRMSFKPGAKHVHVHLSALLLAILWDAWIDRFKTLQRLCGNLALKFLVWRCFKSCHHKPRII